MVNCSSTKMVLIALALIFSSAFFFNKITFAETYLPGKLFHHTYYLDNPEPDENCQLDCSFIVVRITKSWNATNGVLDHVELPGAKPYDSTEQVGSHSYSLEYNVKSGEEVTSSINFYTNPDVSHGQVSSSILWEVIRPSTNESATVFCQFKDYINVNSSNGSMPVEFPCGPFIWKPMP